MPVSKRILALGFAAAFCTISAAHGADSAASDRAKTLVKLMRADDNIVAALTSTARTRCKQLPAEEGKQCDTLAAKLGQDIDREHLLELLAPFFATQFSGEEIEAMIRFYGSDEGRQSTGLLISALNWNSPTVPQLDRATTEKITAYLQSPVSRKFTRLASQFSEEARRQVGSYLCTLFEPRGFSCAALTQIAGFVAGIELLGTAQTAEETYQHEADIFRAAHLIEWAQIIEAYYKKTGHYPLQDRVEGDRILLVQIATREQQAYLDPKNPNYSRAIDNKVDTRLTSVSVKDLVASIERALERNIDERYDPQRVPNGAPIYFSYFVDKNGYLIWAVCRTCPPHSNSFSTLLWTGTPSINIGSKWFIENVRKTQSISSLRANKEFAEFIGKGPTRAGWFDALERSQVHESKN